MQSELLRMWLLEKEVKKKHNSQGSINSPNERNHLTMKLGLRKEWVTRGYDSWEYIMEVNDSNCPRNFSWWNIL
jgi:hypothetical protein